MPIEIREVQESNPAKAGISLILFLIFLGIVTYGVYYFGIVDLVTSGIEFSSNESLIDQILDENQVVPLVDGIDWNTTVTKTNSNGEIVDVIDDTETLQTLSLFGFEVSTDPVEPEFLNLHNGMITVTSNLFLDQAFKSVTVSGDFSVVLNDNVILKNSKISMLKNTGALKSLNGNLGSILFDSVSDRSTQFSFVLDDSITSLKAGENKLDFKFSNVLVKIGDTQQVFTSNDNVVYSVILKKSGDEFFIRDSEGSFVKLIPMDNSISICTEKIFKDYKESTVIANKVRVGTLSATYNGELLGIASVTDISGKDKICDTIDNVPRDSSVTIKIGEPTPYETTIKLPKSQKDIRFTCSEFVSYSLEDGIVLTRDRPIDAKDKLFTQDRGFIGGCNFYN